MRRLWWCLSDGVVAGLVVGSLASWVVVRADADDLQAAAELLTPSRFESSTEVMPSWSYGGDQVFVQGRGPGRWDQFFPADILRAHGFKPVRGMKTSGEYSPDGARGRWALGRRGQVMISLAFTSNSDLMCGPYDCLDHERPVGLLISTWRVGGLSAWAPAFPAVLLGLWAGAVVAWRGPDGEPPAEEVDHELRVAA